MFELALHCKVLHVRVVSIHLCKFVYMFSDYRLNIFSSQCGIKYPNSVFKHTPQWHAHNLSAALFISCYFLQLLREKEYGNTWQLLIIRMVCVKYLRILRNIQVKPIILTLR